MTGSAQHLIGKELFRIGVSYWPRSTGLELWRRFDVDEIQEDFSILSENGANLAQVTLVWEDFQPDPASLRCSALAHLLALCDAAASEGIRLELLLFAGPFGAPSHLPRWLEDAKQRSTDGGALETIEPVARRACIAFAQGIARTVGDHAAVWAYSLGDRSAQTAPERCCVADKAWLDQLSQSIRTVDPKHPLTCSLAGTELVSNAASRIDEVARYLDHATIDSAGLADELGSVDAEFQAAFGCALTTALTGKPCIWQQGSHSTSPDAMLAGAHRVGALGAVIGSSTDLLGPDDDSLPAYTEAIREFARSKPAVRKVPDNPINLGVAPDAYFLDPSGHVKRLCGEFRTWLNSTSDR